MRLIAPCASNDGRRLHVLKICHDHIRQVHSITQDERFDDIFGVFVGIIISVKINLGAIGG